MMSPEQLTFLPVLCVSCCSPRRHKEKQLRGLFRGYSGEKKVFLKSNWGSQLLRQSKSFS